MLQRVQRAVVPLHNPPRFTSQIERLALAAGGAELRQSLVEVLRQAAAAVDAVTVVVLEAGQATSPQLASKPLMWAAWAGCTAWLGEILLLCVLLPHQVPKGGTIAQH